MQRSFLKWAGSKSTSLEKVLSTVPKKGGIFVEPFVGSATVALNTDYDHYVLNDMNKDLIELFKSAAYDPKLLIEAAQQYFQPQYNESEAFYELRAKFNSSTDSFIKSVLFIYLNRHCYNGLTRYNKSGGFNTPFGRYAKPKLMADRILHFAEKFKDAEFTCLSFEDMVIQHMDGSVWYMDPPYLPNSKTANFTAYTGSPFNPSHHKRLDEKCAELVADGAQVFVSNNDVPLVTECYPHLTSKKKFMVSRSISTSIGKRKPVKEVLLGFN